MDPRSTYRETSARGATGPRLVVFLYEQAIQDLRRAALALEERNVELRTQHINHSISVIGHLQATLDREKGGQVALHLDRLYCQVRARLIEVQVKASREILEEQIAILLSVREAWTEVDRATSTPAAAPTAGAYSAAADSGKTETTDWSA